MQKNMEGGQKTKMIIIKVVGCEDNVMDTV